MKLHPGDPAPDFTLPSEAGPLSLGDLAGKWLILYFYPKDFTSGCTTEACEFRDLAPTVAAEIIGISPDPVTSHAKFTAQHQLPFPLLADEDGQVARAYGAYGSKTLYGKRYQGIIRSTFIIDPQGRIAEAWYNVKAAGHAQKVAARLAELQAN